MIYQMHFAPITPATPLFSPLHVLMDMRYVISVDALPAIGNEYYGLAELWLRPRDEDSWIGFTSCSQIAKGVKVILSDRAQIDAWLAEYDIISWCWYTFGKSLSQQAEREHPGITEVLEKMYAAFGDKVPAKWYTHNRGAFRNYWIMDKLTFDEFMQWSYPRVKWLVEKRYAGTHWKIAGFIAERMIILWYMKFGRKVIVPPEGKMIR